MKRILSLLLALAILPVTAFAAGTSANRETWPAISTDLTHIICYGQSFSTGADAPYYPDPAVDGVYIYGSISNSTKGTQLTPLSASAGNQHPIISTGNVLAQLLAASGQQTDIILGSYGSGGKTIAQLMSPERQKQIQAEEGYDYDIASSGRYSIFQSSVSALAQYAQKNAQSISCPAIVYLQGETDQNTDAQLGYPDNPARAGYGAGGDKEKYKEYMSRLKTDMQQEIMTRYGQTEKPLFLIYQVSGTYTRTQYSSINMAQLEFAQENDDVILVQTPYFTSHYTNSHHLTQNGYRWLGEYIGRSIYTALVEREKPWPMLPDSLEITSGNSICITVSGAQGGLTIDTWTVENATNSKNLYGFYLEVDGKNVVPTDISVSGDCITLTVPSDLSAAETVYLYYAGKNAAGTGNIRDNCAELGFYEYLDDSSDIGTGKNQGVSYSALDASGHSLIGKKYPLYNWLASFCYPLPKADFRQYSDYHWEMQETGLISTTAANAAQNDLTLLQGTVESGILKKVQYSMEKTVALYHDRPWVIEWRASGNGSSYGGGKILSASKNNGSDVRYLYQPTDSRGMIAWGVPSESCNYGIRLGKLGIDTRQEHTYRIENRIADDGTNTVYILVDGTEMGDMNTPYSTKDGSQLDQNVNWANGRDIYLDYLGEPSNFLLNNMKLSYLKIWENGIGSNAHTHTYKTTVTSPTCTKQGYTTHTCDCGETYVDTYVPPADHQYKNGICKVCNTSALDSGFIHAKPENQGVANAIARAYQLTDVEWTPAADMPGVKKINGEFTVVPFQAGVTYRGIPYSGVTATDTYVGLNVSLESFLTALQNENSVLYTENLFSTNPKSATYFGTVCSKFAQYVLDIPGSYNTNNVANIPGMDTIALPGEYTVDQIRLGDVVLHTKDHTTVCTDILYDADGNVAFIEISEAVMHLTRRMLWSPEEFYEHFSGYRLCRYQYIDAVPAVDTIHSPENYALMPRLGNKYNYKVSSNTGIVDILQSGYSTAVILRDSEEINRISIDDTTQTFGFNCSIPGHIEMYLEKSDGTRSNSVYANVVTSSITVDDSTRFATGKLTVTIDGTSGTPLYVQVGSAHAIFCNLEGQEGTVELTYPVSKISNRQVRVAYQNAYGIYLSKWVSFTADENPSHDPLLSKGQYWNGYNITPSNPTPVIQENKVGYWSYSMVPVEENTTYYSMGATRLWYLDANGNGISTINAYKDSEVPCQFTTPAGTAYVNIAYSSSLVNQGNEKIEKISSDSEAGQDKDDVEPEKANPSTDPYLSQGEFWEGHTLTPSKSTPVVQSGKLNYWTYTMVPVEGNTTYYSEGANRMWFFTANKKPISTYNAITDSAIRFQFTTPEDACYISVTYSPSVVEKGTEKIEKVLPEHITHTPGETWQSDNQNHWKECSVCGEKTEEGQHVPDNKIPGKCTVCSHEIPISRALEWFLNRLELPDSLLWASGYYSRITE